MPGAASRRYNSVSYWPGFVDALAALLVVVVFLIMVFALAQVFLSDALSGRDSVLEKLTSELDELAQMLDLERTTNAELRLSVSQLSSQLQTSVSERDALVAKLSDVEEALASEQRTRSGEIAELNKTIRNRSSCSCVTWSASTAISPPCARCARSWSRKSPAWRRRYKPTSNSLARFATCPSSWKRSWRQRANAPYWRKKR
jgi:hypothetical protein